MLNVRHHLLAFILINVLVKSLVFAQEHQNLMPDPSYQIMVVREKFVDLENRLQLNLNVGVVTNQAYTFQLLSRMTASYHFSSTWGIGLQTAISETIDRDERIILADFFQVKTQSASVLNQVGIDLTYNPYYGKFELFSNQLAYFDTFFLLGGGLTTVEFDRSECQALDPSGQNTTKTRAQSEHLYPTIYIGAGQRIFLTRSFGFQILTRMSTYGIPEKDLSCDQSIQDSSQVPQFDLSVETGLTYLL